MSETTNPYKLTPVLLKRFHQFAKIDDSTKRFERIIEIGKRLPDYQDQYKAEEHQVKGCVSLTYIRAEIEDGLIQYYGWSNSHLVLGLLALLIEGMSGQQPQDIIQIDPEFMTAMGIAQTLTSSRADGFMNTFVKMKDIAKSHV